MDLFTSIGNGNEEEIYVNICIKPNRIENECMFIKDLQGAYSCLYKKDQEYRYMMVCKKCLLGYKDKKRFDNHVKICVNMKRVQFKFSGDGKDLKSYQTYFNKFNAHPFDIYYDLETTTGSEDENPYMEVMSYVFCVSFNPNMDKEKYKDFYIYRSCVQDTASLGDYDAVPDYIFHQKTKKDIKMLKNSINDVILKRNKLALAHHLTLELKMIIDWMKKYFTTYIIPKYLYLPMDRRNAYVEKHQDEKIKECCICRFKINDSKDKDLLKYLFKKEYVRLLEKFDNICVIFDIDDVSIGDENMVLQYEEFFIKKMMNAYKEV